MLQHFPPYRLMVDLSRLGAFGGGDVTSDPRSGQIHAYKLYSLALVVYSHRIFHASTY